LVEPKSEEVESIQPLEPLFVPKRITGFQVIMAPEEDVLGDLEQTVKPEKMDLSEKPLSPIEKAKLMLYRKLLAAEEGKDGKKTEAGGSGAIGALGSLLGSLAKGIPGMDKMTDEMKKELEDLERRNKRKVEKFMDMLRDNPDEALKYAMPLDDKNTGRGSDAGGMGGEWNMSTRWGDFSLFGDTNYRGRGGGGIDLGDEYFQLQQQYRDTAQAFEKKGKYRKAAFVYFKLLKDYHNAATTLEKGKIYKQAAQVYLKHANNKSKAAECYEKGNLFQEAIDLNIELLRYEKAGDLFLKINERKKADVYYQKTADNYIKSNQYVKASLVYRNKMGERMKGQDILMKGWKNNRDAYNCLNNYFANIEDEKSLSKEMDQVFQNHVSDKNRRSFLRILHHEYDKKNSLGSQVREIAYEAIHEEIKNNPEVVTELKFFNKNDRQLIKDSIRFRSSKNKKKR